MGAKVELVFLSQMDNRDIFINVMKGLQKITCFQGYSVKTYTFWNDGPIWMFGESQNFDVIEKKGVQCVLDEYGDGFSPTMTMDIPWFGKSISVHFSVIENQNEWKEVKFSVDKYEAIDTFSETKKIDVKKCLCEIFKNISLSIDSFYGLGATEIEGLIENPQNLKVDEKFLGDMNYFSKNAVRQIDLEKLLVKYSIELLTNEGVLIIKKDNLLELYE